MKNEVIEMKNEIQSRILTIRGVQVMLDRDLAALYGVEPKQLNRQVQRNIDRFPADFMFQLDKKEVLDLKCQIGTSSWGGDRYLPYAFTEQGVAMLSGVLQRLGAIEVKQLETDKRIDTVFDALGRGNLLPNGLFAPECEFDAMRYVTRLVESAQSSIVLIDPYSDAVTLEVLAKKRSGVTVRLVCKNLGKPTTNEIAKFNR